MGKEIERKFLVKEGFDFNDLSFKKVELRQCYLNVNPELTVRVRIAEDKAYLTMKSKTSGCTRDEWEYEIPVTDAEELMERYGLKKLSKTRYFVRYDDKIWEIDFFHEALEGLRIAEVELREADERISLPPFIGLEVTGDSRFYNSCLATTQKIPD